MRRSGRRWFDACRHARPASASGRSGRHRGQAIAELALITPVMLVLMLVAVDFGRLFFSYIAVQNAAREATSYAAFHAADTPWDGTAYRTSIAAVGMQETNVQAQGGAGMLTLSDPTCYVQDSSTTIDCHAASDYGVGIGNQVVVTAWQPFTFVTPIIGEFFGGSLTLTASSRAPIMNPATVAIQPGPSQTPVPTPSPSPSPSPSPTLPPGATPTPAPPPSPSPSPTPIATCEVPDLIGMFYNDLGLQAWQVSGFTGELDDKTKGEAITSQTMTPHTLAPCSSSMRVDR